MKSVQKTHSPPLSTLRLYALATVPLVLGALCVGPVAFAQNMSAMQAASMPRPAPQEAQGNAPQNNTARKNGPRHAALLPWGAGGLEPTTTGGSYAMLTQLKEENILLDQQLKIAQKTKQLQALERQGSSGDSSNSSSGGPSLADLAALGGEPRVLLVEGLPGHVHAMISLPSGGTITAKIGEYVPHVGKVISITADTVLVRTSKHNLSTIPFWSSFGSTAPSGSSSGYNVMPPPIPGQETSAPSGPSGPQPTSPQF